MNTDKPSYHGIKFGMHSCKTRPVHELTNNQLKLAKAWVRDDVKRQEWVLRTQSSINDEEKLRADRLKLKELEAEYERRKKTK